MQYNDRQNMADVKQSFICANEVSEHVSFSVWEAEWHHVVKWMLSHSEITEFCLNGLFLCTVVELVKAMRRLYQNSIMNGPYLNDILVKWHDKFLATWSD